MCVLFSCRTEGFDKDADGGIRLWELMAELDKQTSAINGRSMKFILLSVAESQFSFDRITAVEEEVKALRAALAPRKQVMSRLVAVAAR